jgi:hypothetical protein
MVPEEIDRPAGHNQQRPAERLSGLDLDGVIVDPNSIEHEISQKRIRNAGATI